MSLRHILVLIVSTLKGGSGEHHVFRRIFTKNCEVSVTGRQTNKWLIVLDVKPSLQMLWTYCKLSMSTRWMWANSALLSDWWGLIFTVGGVFSRKRRIKRASSSAVIRWLTMATSSSTSTVWHSEWWPEERKQRQQLLFTRACTKTDKQHRNLHYILYSYVCEQHKQNKPTLAISKLYFKFFFWKPKNTWSCKNVKRSVVFFGLWKYIMIQA